MYYDKVMSSIIDNDMDPLLMLKFISECVMFCFSERCFYYSTFYNLLEMFYQEFRLSQHSTGNWKFVISIGMPDGGRFKLTTRETKRSDETKNE